MYTKEICITWRVAVHIYGHLSLDGVIVRDDEGNETDVVELGEEVKGKANVANLRNIGWFSSLIKNMPNDQIICNLYQEEILK